MPATKANIIAQLQKEILPLQGFKRAVNGIETDVGLGAIKYAFPENSFPLGAVHEFICTQKEEATATTGFIAGMIASLMSTGGAALWIGSSQTIFPPALKYFGIDPDKIVFIYLKKDKDIIWAMEEALKCEGLAAVIGEMKGLSFTASRRFQLAVEQSRVTGFILRNNPINLTTTACVTRWEITSLSSASDNNIPGVGFPRWNIELLKVRNGKPGSWQIEWVAGKFRHINKVASMDQEQQRKTG